MNQTVSRATVDHPSTYYAASAMNLRCYPQIIESVNCDTCVIGGGYTGLSTALNLAEKGYDVVLLEARRVGWGASGRNGGQVGSGLNWSQSKLEKEFGMERAAFFWNLTEMAKKEVVNRIARHSIPCDYKSGVMAVAVSKKAASEIERNTAHLQEKYAHHAIRYVHPNETQDLLGTTQYFGGALDTSSGHLHPLNFAIGLANAAADAGVRIFEHSPVLSYRKTLTGYGVDTVGGTTVSARQVVLACNAYIDGLSSQVSRYIIPLESLIVATEPLSRERALAINREDIAIYDSKFCLDYYRLSADRRLLFGGGEVYVPNMPVNIAAKMKQRILAVYPQLNDIKIEYTWRGKIAITRNRLPSIGRLDADVYYAQGFSGHGVALTGLVGKIIAEIISGTVERYDVLASIPHKSFPGGHFLRWPIHVIGMYYGALSDRLFARGAASFRPEVTGR